MNRSYAHDNEWNGCLSRKEDCDDEFNILLPPTLRERTVGEANKLCVSVFSLASHCARLDAAFSLAWKY